MGASRRNHSKQTAAAFAQILKLFCSSPSPEGPLWGEDATSWARVWSCVEISLPGSHPGRGSWGEPAWRMSVWFSGIVGCDHEPKLPGGVAKSRMEALCPSAPALPPARAELFPRSFAHVQSCARWPGTPWVQQEVSLWPVADTDLPHQWRLFH